MKFPKDKEQMVIDNMGLVKKIASSMAIKYRTPLADYDDLVQVGSIGLMRAVETFDESKGFKFSTFAYRTIRGYIMHEFSKSTPIRAPAHIVNLASLILKRGQQDDAPEELAMFYKHPVSRINNALHYLIFNVASADAQVRNDDEETFHSIHGTVIDYDESMTVKEFLDLLKPRERTIVTKMMTGKDMVEVAEELGLSKQRIHQIIIEIRKLWSAYEKGYRRSRR